MRVGLVAIVKDEAPRLPAMLRSAYPHLASWTIADTGSTDGTPLVVEDELAGIPGRLYRDPWVNFGANRSLVLGRARGTADWLLCLDADMTVSIDAAFEPDPEVDAYMIDMGDPDMGCRLPLLLRGDLPWESRGVVHEYTCMTDGSIGRRVPTDAVRVTYEDRSSPEKTAWHISLLRQHLAEHPDDPRTTFYLAQALRFAGDPEAWGLYMRRANMGGYEEERWYAQYRAACLTGTPESLLAAWEARPQRLEPLHDALRILNGRGLHHAAYRLASLPCEPCTDELFVHRAPWEWGIAFERSVAAWWVGEREEARRLNAELLANPHLPAEYRASVIANAAFL